MPKGSQEAAKTHCPQGHPYDEANTRLCHGSRFCRQCDSEAHKRQRRAGGKVIVLNADRTHCPRGHEYTAENTRRSVQGGRVCRTCDRDKQVARDIANPALPMWTSARQRARKSGVPFRITPDDIVIPPCCPVLGIPIQRGAGRLRDASPSLDRIIPAEGYVVGNIAVISYRANRIKNDSTLEELERITAWVRETLGRKEA
jgi:hypothetical protein